MASFRRTPNGDEIAVAADYRDIIVLFQHGADRQQHWNALLLETLAQLRF